MDYVINQNMTTDDCALNLQEFFRVNRGFDGKIKAADQRKIFGDNVLGRKSIRDEGPRGGYVVYMTINPRGDEIARVWVAPMGRVYKVDAGYWGGKDIPEVGDYFWAHTK